MNELKPEDVIMALECCSKSNSVDACMSGCPLWETDTCPCVEDEAALMKAALALLREKDALLEQWDADLKTYEAMLMSKDAEIERLREIIVKGDYSSHAARLETETWHRNNSEIIRRLEAEIERLGKLLDDGYWDFADDVRADAITEFAERLKASLNDVARWQMHGVEGEYFIIGKSFIDRVAEEMKGAEDE